MQRHLQKYLYFIPTLQYMYQHRFLGWAIYCASCLVHFPVQLIHRSPYRIRHTSWYYPWTKLATHQRSIAIHPSSPLRKFNATYRTFYSSNTSFLVSMIVRLVVKLSFHGRNVSHLVDPHLILSMDNILLPYPYKDFPKNDEAIELSIE